MSQDATKTMTVDANEAVASVAYRMNEVISIYPITPSSPMGEFCDEWAVKGRENIWNTTPQVVQMQSEGGVAGAVHGSLQAGALTTTFTASQGLLLMQPNMYKIAGELNAFCLHVAARTLATHALSIFCDHSDVMSCRTTGFAMLCSNSVQEAHDLACVAQAATLQARVPVMHFFDGFRTSHEVSKIIALGDDELRAMTDEDAIAAHRKRALTPDAPVLRGTAQNPDTFFQAREGCNGFYEDFPQILQSQLDQFEKLTGRRYELFEYVGAPDAERVIMLMGSACETAQETVEYLVEKGEKVGLIKVRLFRPFVTEALMSALPKSVKTVAVLDRTKEPGGLGEPLYQDVVTALHEATSGNGRAMPVIVGGRYGLSSKEFTPAMVKGVLDEIAKPDPKNHFTVGIVDDVTNRSIPFDSSFSTESDDVVRAVFFGLGADGTVGANKNSIKIIGDHTDKNVQGYFVYDSKKSGAQTISHLRFGASPIRSTYLIDRANFVACHQFLFLDRYDVLDKANDGATFLLNAPYGPDDVWDHLPREVQEQIVEKRLRFYVIDAQKVAGEAGMGRRINTVMQACFFALSNVLPEQEAIELIKEAIRKTYSSKGDEIVRRNIVAVEAAVDNLHEVTVPGKVTATRQRVPMIADEAPDLVKRVTSVMLAGKGDLLPVSAFAPDGTWPTATTQWEKRSIAAEIPIWSEDVCIQCNKCALVCPHAAIRAGVYEAEHLSGAPNSFQSVDYKAPDFKGLKFTIQVAPEDCTGCNLCVMVCPAKDKANPRRKAINMEPLPDHVDRERTNYAHFLKIPPVDPTRIERMDAKGSQFRLPLFEYSGACAGCGETPYVKLLTQLFGDRLLISNATGCSSIYGGNLPTTPYCTDSNGRGPTWSNSLFEDNAEFGFGFRMAIDQHTAYAHHLMKGMAGKIGEELVTDLLNGNQLGDAEIAAQRQRVEQLRSRLAKIDTPEAEVLGQIADYLVPKSVWLMGGDGWAYDIGYGGLDHVLASGRNVNILVLDTEVYSNTGGQQSKATPLGAAAKFAIAGKEIHKKDLGLMAMSYGHVYVASIAFGANDNQTVRAFLEAEAYSGPSLIIAYSHCIAHGYDLRHGAEQQKRAVQCGIWPLYRFDPRNVLRGTPPLNLDSPRLKGSVHDYMDNEARYRMVQKIDPIRYRKLGAMAAKHSARRVELYRQLASLQFSGNDRGGNGKGNGIGKPVETSKTADK